MHVTIIVNGVDLDRLSGTIDAVTAQPRAGPLPVPGRTTGSTAATAEPRSRTSTALAKKTPSAPSRSPWTATSRGSWSARTGRQHRRIRRARPGRCACRARSSTTPPRAASRWTAWRPRSRATWTCTASSAWRALSAGLRPDPGHDHRRPRLRRRPARRAGHLSRYSPVRDIVCTPSRSPSTWPAPERTRTMSAPSSPGGADMVLGARPIPDRLPAPPGPSPSGRLRPTPGMKRAAPQRRPGHRAFVSRGAVPCPLSFACLANPRSSSTLPASAPCSASGQTRRRGVPVGRADGRRPRRGQPVVCVTVTLASAAPTTPQAGRPAGRARSASSSCRPRSPRSTSPNTTCWASPMAPSRPSPQT